nr:Hsp20/alpha crystallin family protein [Aneurinibacillus sp. XH2]
MSDRNSGSFDWKSLEKLFGGPLPFMAEALKQRAQAESSWVENYVKQILKGPGKIKSQNGLEHELVESQDDLIVKIKIPDHINPRNLKLFVGHNSLKLNGLSAKSRVVRLPKNVIGESAKAVLKKGVLQVRMPKDYEGDFFNEIRIRIR